MGTAGRVRCSRTGTGAASARVAAAFLRARLLFAVRQRAPVRIPAAVLPDKPLEPPADIQPRRVETDVAPLEPQSLALPQTTPSPTDQRDRSAVQQLPRDRAHLSL